MTQLIWGPGSMAVVRRLLEPGTCAVTPASKLVYLALYSLIDDRCECYPSAKHLALGTGLSVKTVRRRLDELERAGLMRRMRAPGRLVTYRLEPPRYPRPATT